ncbi:MAG TPA: phosphonate C-P lyase system protein PhnL [Stellaceae bacterium]|nr:phosphonate C-P lyase system protein PhnL [Stellaceae bacterium]
MTATIEIFGLEKSFTLHLRAGTRLGVLRGLNLIVEPGECLALQGASGAGKSTILRCIYGNYRPDAGRILVRMGAGVVDVAAAAPREILKLRRMALGYVSQFLRVVPRVPAIALVMEPALERGATQAEARERAAALLFRLNIPPKLWDLPPATFSGGEQQRINIARGLVGQQPILLLDEPTASLDAENRAAVIELLREARGRGATVIGVFHDREVRDAVATRTLDLVAEKAA